MPRVGSGCFVSEREGRGDTEAPEVSVSHSREPGGPPVSPCAACSLEVGASAGFHSWFFVFFPEGSRGMERTVVMDKSKGEPVISVKTTSRSKERVSIASAISGPTDLRVV